MTIRAGDAIKTKPKLNPVRCKLVAEASDIEEDFAAILRLVRRVPVEITTLLVFYGMSIPVIHWMHSDKAKFTTLFVFLLVLVAVLFTIRVMPLRSEVRTLKKKEKERYEALIADFNTEVKKRKQGS